MENIDLDALFDEMNEAHFNNEVPKIPVSWNNRLRTTAGRCFCARVRGGRWGEIKPTRIDLANRLFQNNDWDEDKVKRTLIHEMVHAWLYEHYNERGHTWRFQEKMTDITGEWKNHRCHSYDTKGLREERDVEIVCVSHGVIGHRRRMPRKNRTYHHSGCGHSVSFRRKQTVAVGGISLD